MSKYSKSLRQFNIFELLGLSSLSDQQKQEYLTRIIEITTSRSITKALDQGELTEEHKKNIDQMIENNADFFEVQNYIKRVFPNINPQIEEEVTILKAEAVTKQIRDFLQYLRQTQNITPSSEENSTLQKLEEALTNQSEDLQMLVRQYDTIKEKYKFSPTN